MCGTAPVTPPAGAFELEVEESHWDNVYRAIEYIKTEQRKKNMTQQYPQRPEIQHHLQ